MIDRRHFNRLLPTTLATAGGLGACAEGGDPDYATAARQTWQAGPLQGLQGRALSLELVRCATLAPSSHNTQCWRFGLEPAAVTVLPDLSRRCPVVDPDDHHLFVSLGCASENLALAARAHGLQAEAGFDPARGAVHIALAPAPAEATELFHAIPARQSTRGDYDGRPLAAAELHRLEAAGRSAAVDLLLLTERPALETVLHFVVQGNTAQMADPAFVAELRQWIRFNGTEAVRQGDGLFSASSGNPEIPGWLGRRVFGLVFKADAENDKYTRQLRSSAGVAVFTAARDDPAHWVEVGRAFERFALQATALGIRTAHLNMPVEVAALRPAFASAIGLGGRRPDLVVRFGRGPTLPPSLRRPVSAVLV